MREILENICIFLLFEKKAVISKDIKAECKLIVLKKKVTEKVEFNRFSSILNKTKNLKEKKAKLNRGKHLYLICFANESLKRKFERKFWNIFLLCCKISCVI